MDRTRESRECEFEELLIDILEQDHDLAVRRAGESLNRRRRDVATLHFKYAYVSGSPDEAKVAVTIDGFDGFSMTMRVDLSSDDAIQASAEESEGLALFLSEHLERKKEETASLMAEGKLGYGRREDD